MANKFQIKIIHREQKDGYQIFTYSLQLLDEKKEYTIYASDKDIPRVNGNPDPAGLEQFALDQMNVWITDSDNKFPKDKYRVLVNGGKINTDKIESFLSFEKKTSDLVRTNVTIYAPLFEWAKAKAQKEGTSFSDLVSRGLMTLKDSDNEIEAWFKEQGAYFRKKLGDYGSFELFHYLPNAYLELGPEVLKESLEKAEIKRTGWPIGVYLIGENFRPTVQEDGIKAEYSDTPNLRLDYWYAKNKGEFYFSRILESDSGHGDAEPKTSFYFDTLVWRVAESLEHCLAYYESLGVNNNERVKIRVSLYGLNNRKLSAWNQMRAFTLRHYVCGSDKSSWEIETSLVELKNGMDEVIYDAAKKLLVMFDFFVPNKEVVFDILNREYRKSNY